MQAVFPDAVVVVTLDSEAGQETGRPRASGLAARSRRQRRLRAIAGLATEGPRTRSLERERRSVISTSRSAAPEGASHTYPVSGRGEARRRRDRDPDRAPRLVKSEWELLGAFAAQAAQALERARAFEHEHELAMRLQQSLLPADLPAARA